MSSKKIAKKNGWENISDEHIFRMIFENHTAMMLLVDSQTDMILNANQAAVDFYGYPKSKLCGMSINEINILTPDQMEAERQKALALKQDFIAFPHRLADGEERIVEVRSTTIDINGEKIIFLIIHDITEHIKSGEALLKSESHYRSLFESGLTGILITRPDGAVLSANPEACRLLGRTEEELFNLGREGVVNPADPRLAGALAERARTGNFHGELTFIRADGTIFPVEIVSDIVYDSTGQYHANIFFQDITERKSAEETLRESQALYHSLVEISALSICRKDISGRFTFANRRFLELSNTTADDLIGKTDFDIHPPQLAEKYQRDDRVVMESRQVVELIEERALLNGEYGVVQTIKTPILDGDGKVTGVQISFWDITRHKQAENALRESEEKFRTIIELSSDGILLINEQGIIIEWNHAQEEITGIPRAEAIGFPVWDIQFRQLPKERRDQTTAEHLKQSVLQILETGQYGLFQPNEIKIETVSGALRTLLQNAFPIKTNNGYRLGIVFHDITARKLAETELLNTKDALVEANTELQSSLVREQMLSRTDGLTGVYNRRHLFELAEREFELAIRHKQPLAVLMLDLDHFKNVNDVFGHDIGDQVLTCVVQIVIAEMRNTDVIGRYGGEEFIIVLPMTNAKQAYMLAERIRTDVESLRISSEKGDVSTTLSIGIIEINHSMPTESIDDLFRRADKAMYNAKQAGRNRTVIYDT